MTASSAQTLPEKAALLSIYRSKVRGLLTTNADGKPALKQVIPPHVHQWVRDNSEEIRGAFHRPASRGTLKTSFQLLRQNLRFRAEEDTAEGMLHGYLIALYGTSEVALSEVVKLCITGQASYVDDNGKTVSLSRTFLPTSAELCLAVTQMQERVSREIADLRHLLSLPVDAPSNVRRVSAEKIAELTGRAARGVAA